MQGAPYADPEDHAFPLGGGHLAAAESLFAMHKDSYTPEKRAEIAGNIASAKREHGE